MPSDEFTDSDDIEVDGIRLKEQVHIVPLGYEHHRVTIPAIKMNADKVLLVYHSGDEPTERPAYYMDIINELEAEGIEVNDTNKCDIFDLYTALGTIAELIQENAEHEVFVNLASGGKVTAIAGMIACMITEEAEPFYVGGQDYGDSKQPVVTGVSSISKLPTYHIESPPEDQLMLLDYIRMEGSVSKQECINFALDAELGGLAGKDPDASKSLYRLLDSRLLNPLLDFGYIEIHKEGRKKFAEITKEGENTIDAFKYMLERNN